MSTYTLSVRIAGDLDPARTTPWRPRALAVAGVTKGGMHGQDLPYADTRSERYPCRYVALAITTSWHDAGVSGWRS